MEDALAFLDRAFPDFSGDSAFETRLILSEALLNAVMHGNECDISKKVFLEIKAYSDYSIVIKIKDEGAGFDYGSVLSRKASERSLMDENGRGIMLMNLLADGFSYNERGNRVRIYKKVDLDE